VFKVVQYCPSITDADAVGFSVVQLHRALQAAGISSELYCGQQREIPSSDLKPVISLLQQGLAGTPPDITIIHYCFLDDTTVHLARLPGHKILVYHNITPGHFFKRPGMEQMASLGDDCDRARVQLASMHHMFDIAVGVSDYNALELRQLGFRNVTTIPVFVNTDFFSSDQLDSTTFNAIRSKSTANIAFVGRFVPNKAIEDVIGVLAQYKRMFGPDINLHLIGKIWDQAYYSSLLAHAAQNGVLDLIRTHIALEPVKLKTVFAAVDAFVSMSQHEGFMVPVIEAFAAGCPVIARNAGAVGDTMGDAGFLLADANTQLAASLVRMLSLDSGLRERVIAGQRRRAFHFRTENTARRWLNTLHGADTRRKPDGSTRP
jgi:glycosyltransferase involved in cell wall biosynthesis